MMTRITFKVFSRHGHDSGQKNLSHHNGSYKQFQVHIRKRIELNLDAISFSGKKINDYVLFSFGSSYCRLKLLESSIISRLRQ